MKILAKAPGVIADIDGKIMHKANLKANWKEIGERGLQTYLNQGWGLLEDAVVPETEPAKEIEVSLI